MNPLNARLPVDTVVRWDNRRSGRLAADQARLAVAVADQNGTRRRRTVSVVADGGLLLVAEHEDTSSCVGREAQSIDAIILGLDVIGPMQLPEIEATRAAVPNASIVVITSTLGRRSIKLAVDAGVDAVVLEERVGECLAIAVRAACAGQLSVPRESRTRVGKPLLSAREKQILGMVVLGFTNSYIARKLYVAESTVKSHLSSAFSKLGVSSRNEATALILDPENGLGTGILAISNGDGENGIL